MAIDTLSLQGKIAIVTGSGRENGIGAGIAIVLAKNGAAVTIHYIHDSTTQRAHAVAHKIKVDGGKAIVVQGSIETPQGAQYLVDETLKGFNADHVDILVNNAGVGMFGETLTANQSDITQAFDVNVKGPIFVAQAVVPVMPPGGRIINISSIASKLGDDSVPIYGASKAAIDSLTWSWAKEWGRSKKITVNSVAPGPVTTDSNPYEEFQKPSIDITRASDRAGTPEDIADAVLLLVSEKARWITGQYISNVDCVYRDARQPKIDYNTQVLLERMQLLEDRILSNPPSSARNNPPEVRNSGTEQPALVEQVERPSNTLHGGNTVPQEPMFEVQIPLSHTANANHVFSWRLVQELLSETSKDGHDIQAHCDATDVFFHHRPNNSHPSTRSHPPSSWNLFERITESFHNSVDDAVLRLCGLIHLYFTDVNIFFPLLLKSDMIEIFEAVIGREAYGDKNINVVEMPQYGLLLVVLCLALLSSSGRSNIRLDGKGEDRRPLSDSDDTVETQTRLMYHLWDKARLVLGYISTDMSIAAAQSSMLASIFMGACGQVAEAFHWAHATAVKCESMARSYAKNEPIPDSFRRLYWISFIYECDFISEISVVSPSGIARSENKIPYPAFTTENHVISPSAPESSEMALTRSQEELVAFQITTNSAIRRFLNTVNSVVYDDKEQFRTRQSNYACWLLRISEDLWSHHSAIYRNLPEFLLTNSSQDVSMAGTDTESPASLQSPTARIRDLPTGNNSWNILRLKGRYYAGQYIIHRPFIEFIVLNIDNFETHPSKDAVLKKSKSCLDGCMGFIKVFDVETVNALTCLFPTGMVTFTMTIILMISTIVPVLRELLPTDVEEVIETGKRNLLRFSQSVTQFEWHIQVLENLETARRARKARFGT
ncbi:hypothetical protein FAUST_8614 [Fusarium austroamericanum]|uniref:Transcription factor domain-containing protein n=1 Tax=Fusarium austroamericanum TaxID=282268 RepID=A0AAN5Z444_FUSAU|nr:hypothetical protein FAUST_8614 [Fusarium austroamericanum]